MASFLIPFAQSHEEDACRSIGREPLMWVVLVWWADDQMMTEIWVRQELLSGRGSREESWPETAAGTRSWAHLWCKPMRWREDSHKGMRNMGSETFPPFPEGNSGLWPAPATDALGWWDFCPVCCWWMYVGALQVIKLLCGGVPLPQLPSAEWEPGQDRFVFLHCARVAEIVTFFAFSVWANMAHMIDSCKGEKITKLRIISPFMKFRILSPLMKKMVN